MHRLTFPGTLRTRFIMPDTPDSQAPAPAPAPAATIDPESINTFLRNFGLVVNNITFYGQKHNVTRKSVEHSFAFLGKLLGKHERLNLSLSEGTLLVEGQPIETKNPLVDGLVKQLVALDVGGFTLERGMTWEDFWKLMMLVSTHPDKVKEMGTFSDAVSHIGLGHVQARKVTYQLITEEDMVVKKDAMETAAVEGAVNRDLAAELIAFLKGENAGQNPQIAQDIGTLALDVGKLAEVIVETARNLKEQSGPDGQSLAKMVVNCLRKTYDGLLEDPSARTQQGKKQLTKLLNNLEEKIEDKLKETPEAVDEAGTALIEETVEEMTTELAVDALASEYVKRRRNIETTENRILKFLKTKGADEHGFTEELKEKLIESGLTPEGWQDLLVKSVTAAAAVAKRARAEGADEEQALAGLLVHVEELLNPARLGADGKLPAQELSQAVTQISKEMVQVTADTERKLKVFEKKILEFMKPEPEGTSPADQARVNRAARKALFEILAEIVQELCQPLSVVSSTVDMIRSGLLGKVSETQVEMLTLASSSADRIKHLVDKLTQVAGFPGGTKPDAEILRSLYHSS
jgi:hypothetical protein